MVAAGGGVNANLTDGDAYVYETSGSNAGTYVAINGITAGTYGSLIGSSEAFFVKTLANNNTVTFNDGMKSIGANAFLRTGRTWQQLLTLNISGNGFNDATRVAFGTNFSTAFDYGADASKLMSRDGQPSVFVTENTDKYSVYAQPPVNQQVRDIPV